MSASLREELASLKIERPDSTSKRFTPQRGVAEGRAPGRRGFGVPTFLIWLIPVGLVGGGAYYGYAQYRKLQPSQEVSVGLVQAMTSGEAEKLLSAKGYIKSRHQAMIGAKTPGRVEQLFVEEGTRLRKGDTIAILEHHDTDAILESRRATTARTTAELREAKVNLHDKDRKARREAKLYAQSHSSVENVEKAEAERDMAAARVAALESAVRLMKASEREVEETIRNLQIVAPFDGTVVSRDAEVGETIAPGGMGGASGRGSVVSLADLSQLDVETDVAESLLARIAVGQPAEVAVSAVPSKHYRGRLRQIIPMGDRSRGTIKVKVEILDPDDKLFPDLVATVHFLPDRSVQNPDAGHSYLFMPRDAVYEENGHAYAWVVDSKARVHKTPIEVVVTHDLARVEKGLKGGESVVLNNKPGLNLHEGELVKVVD